MAKAVWTTAQIVAQLDRDGHFWQPGSTVEYAFQTSLPTKYSSDSGLEGFQASSAIERQFVRLAFAELGDLINLDFTEGLGNGRTGASDHRITVGASTTLPDYEWGETRWSYYTDTQRMAGGDIFMSETSVNARSWVINGYNFMATMHEIMHALGVDHPGDYNADGSDITYAKNAAYFQDSRQYTIMSYFAASETGANFSLNNVIYSAGTPLRDDIAALQAVYGANMSTRTDDTVYGFHATAGRDVYDATKTPVQIYSVWDAGGNDTFDFSGYSANQVIDLHQGAFSNVGGLIGNVSIAYGAQIENAIGGSGNDILLGNELNNVLSGGAGQDVMSGGGGNDTFRDSLANLLGDRITDFGRGDTINITDASYATFSYSRQLWSVTLTPGRAVSLDGLTGHLIVSADPNGGVDLSLGARMTGLNDFNGDGHSDILWRNNVSGTFATWQLTGNVTPQAQLNVDVEGGVPLAWRIEGTIDFNGDGASDLVWRNPASGAFAIWDATGSGNFTANTVWDGSVAPSWTIAGFGDFNGDGKDDILWRNTDGTVAEWQSTGSSFVQNTFREGVDNSWRIQSIADFNGDGKADVLWRNNNGALTTWTSTGTGFNENTYSDGSVATSWHIAATGDFNGDGKDDILWRNDNGALAEWQSTGSGFVQNVYTDNVATSWHIAGLYDFNDDGKADILWRHDGGALSVWLSTGNGFVQNAFVSGAPTDWVIATHAYDII